MNSNEKAHSTDLVRWTFRNNWSVEEAALLFGGYAPDLFEAETGAYEIPIPGARPGYVYPEEVAGWLLLIARIRNWHPLTGHPSTPLEWIAWARSIGIEIPEALATRLCKKENEITLLNAGSKPRKAKSSAKRDRAKAELKKLFPDGVPNQQDLPNKSLVKRVFGSLKESGYLETISPDTILRAANRSK